MARKDTVWGARHKLEENEIQRIIEYYEKTLSMNITILEASAVQAARSMDAHWNEEKAKAFLRQLRGVL